MSRCDRCPMKGDAPCAGEAGKWAGLACKMAESGEAGVRWVVDKSTGAEAEKGAVASEPPPAYPPLATQAANFAKAVGRFVASGFKVARKAERRRRRAICEACPMYDAAAKKCRACGCIAALKPWSEAESCPRGKW